MTTPNPPAGLAVPTTHSPEHAALGRGLRADLEWVTREMDRIGAQMVGKLTAEIRSAATPAHVRELATLCREVAAGSRDAAELVAWLGAHGL